jgi:nitrite reductase/ring-hydroxylating ferredoxin subunit
MPKITIAKTTEISDGKVLKASANGQSVLVAKVGNEYCAIANKCPHLGLPMTSGKVANGTITCPFHAAKFDLRTGKNVEWVNSVAGIPVSGFAQKMLAMGKTATDVASFAVTQTGEDLTIEV